MAGVPPLAPNGQGRYVCRTCAGVLNNLPDYEQHYQAAHLCTKCGDDFGDTSYLQHANECSNQQPGMVPTAPSKGSQVTTIVNKPVVEEHYDGEQQEWTDWLGEFEEAVTRGLCDEILRPIAKAVFDRRDVLNGQKAGTSMRNLTSPPKSAKPENELAPSKSHGTAQFAVDGTFVGKVREFPKDTRGGVEVLGKTYLRKDIVGLVIQIPRTGHNLPEYVMGLRVKVTGVGEKRAKVEWVDKPKDGSAYRKDADAGKPTFLPLTSLTGILG